MASRESKHPFYRPLWVRLLIIAFCLAWCAYEWWRGDTIWGLMMVVVSAYAVWALMIAYRPDEKPGPDDKPEQP